MKVFPIHTLMCSLYEYIVGTTFFLLSVRQLNCVLADCGTRSGLSLTAECEYYSKPVRRGSLYMAYEIFYSMGLIGFSVAWRRICYCVITGLIAKDE